MSFLQKGDFVGIIAPSVGLKDKDIEPVLSYLDKLGLRYILADNIGHSYRYMAGTDKERAEEINRLFADTRIKALFCLRGGAGATRLLPYLNMKVIKKNLKPIIGLSDSAALQNALFVKTGNPSLTGFLPLYDVRDGKVNSQTEKSLINALFEDKHKIISGVSRIDGEAEGEIVGGCLSVLLYLCGTSYFPDLSGKILLLEDTEEKTYKIDLMFNQLKQQKGFAKLKGIIFGAFTDCMVVDEEDGSVDDCISDMIQGLNIPVVTNFDYGHIAARYVVPLGVKVKLKADKKSSVISW